MLRLTKGNCADGSKQFGDPGALEEAGIEFIDENGGGPGVRLKKSIKGKGRK